MSVRTTGAFACLVLASVGCEDHDHGVNNGADGGVDGGGGACEQPLAADVLDRLVTGFEPHFQMKPGTSMPFQLGTSECCYSFETVDACATWSVSPATGASIDADGKLTVDASATDGDVFTVTANVENGRKLIESKVYIYTPEGNPFVGLWHEQSQFACQGGAEAAPSQAINELRFDADHSIRVTWQPFELYVDYWGTYSYTLGTGAFSFDVTGGNYVPTDIDSMGQFSINSDGDLVLSDLWLGSPRDSSAPAACGHVFSR